MDLFYKIEDKPPFVTSLLLALQHLLAALGGIIAVPLVVGGSLGLSTEDTVVLVSSALLISGVVTIIQCKGAGPIGARMPCVMGTSFTFVAVGLVIGREQGVAGIMGASLIGSLVMLVGSRYMHQVRKLFPPVVTGTVVAMIGLSMLPIAVDWFAGGHVGEPGYASALNISVAFGVLALVVVLAQWGRGIFAAAAIVIGMFAGYLACWALGMIDFSPVASAPLFAIPQPFKFGMTFSISGIIGMSIAYLVTVMESTGNFLAISDATETELTGRKLSRGIFCEGLGSALAALFSTTPFSSFSQNVGVIAITGVASRHVVALTGALLLLAGLFPMLSAIVVTIPQPVLGGAGLVMFAMIVAAGVKILGRIPHTKRNSLIIAISVAFGMAVTVRPELLHGMSPFVEVVFGSGITAGSISALLLNRILPSDDAASEAEAEAEAAAELRALEPQVA